MQPQIPDGALPEELLGAVEGWLATAATVVVPDEGGGVGGAGGVYEECELGDSELVLEDPELVDDVGT